MDKKIIIILGCIAILLILVSINFTNKKICKYDSSKEYNNPVQKEIIENGKYEQMKEEYFTEKINSRAVGTDID